MLDHDDAFDIDPNSFLADETFEPVDAGAAPGASSSATGIASLERIEQELGDVEQALTRLDEGRYGTCATCGAAVADVALSERPTESNCADHRADPSTG